MFMHARTVAWFTLLSLSSSFAAQSPGETGTPETPDPFLQATSGLSTCPRAQLPVLSEAEIRAQEHVRVQHGGSCYRSGRCRLPNSYLYDAEIVPRVALYISEDGRFADTSVWILGQRRLVTLMGCVRSQEQSAAMERAVLLVDDVMGVVNQLKVSQP